ncbi:MAG: hypothetical protein ACJ8F7_20285 [Gemmataceae bacterium]
MFRYTLSLTAALAFGVATLAQNPGNLIDDVRRRQEIATQQAEADVTASLKQARLAASTAEAVAILQKALDRVEQNPDLNADRQAKMVRQLKDALRLRDAGSRVAAPGETPRQVRERRQAAEKAADNDKIRTTLDEIAQLQKAGNYAKADQLAEQLRHDYPDNPAVVAMGRRASTRVGVESGRDIRRDQEERTRQELGPNLTRSGTPIAGDIQFDKKYWDRISQARKETLSKKEQALLEALNKPVKAEFRNSILRDVMEYLSTEASLPILLDKKALEDQNVNEETTAVTFAPPKTVALRTALRKILGDQGLTYVIKDEAIYVTSVGKAREMMTTRTYYVGDLVNALPNPTLYAPAVVQQAKMNTAKAIIDMIKDSVDPLSWLGNGGSGTITFSPIGDAIVVRQSAEVHMMLKSSFK